jgi:serum/glucocorticoid-regulated kinase 2
MAPEVLKSEGYGLAVDWWGIGIMLYEMLVGLPPFYDQNIQAMYVKISNADLSFPPHVHLYARDIITRFLDRDPKTRLGVNGVQEVKQHLFFEGVDWDAMAKKQVKPTWVPTKEEIEGLLLIPDEFKGEENYDSDCEEWEEDDNDFGCSFDEKNWEEVPAQRFVMNLRTCNKFKDLDLFYTEE